MSSLIRPVSGIYNQYLLSSGYNEINAVKYNHETETLAVARKSSIELWNCSHYLHKVCNIIDIPKNSLEDVVWCGNKLYSAGLNGNLYQYDIDNLDIADKFPITGGPTHCLACSDNNEFIAAGTETGNVGIFEVNEGFVTFKTFFKQNSRIVSLAWHSNNNILIAGSMNEVYVLNVKTGKSKTIKIPSAENTQGDIAVHAVQILEDMTVVTGDSRGCVCFLDAKLGTYIRKDKSHKGAVLCLQKAENDKVIYATGIDSSVAKFMYNVEKNGPVEWVRNMLGRCGKSSLRSIDYDQKTNTFFTGGDDFYVYRISSTALGNLWVESYPITPPIGYASIAESVQRLFLGSHGKIEMYQMSQLDRDGPENKCFKMANFLMEEKRILRSASISRSGEYFAYVDTCALRIYRGRFSPEDVLEENLKISEVELNSNIGDYRQIQFLDESRLLAAKNNVIQVIKICLKSRKLCAIVKNTIEIADGAVRLIVPSSNGDHFAVTNSLFDVYIFSSSNFKSHKLPNAGALPTAISFDLINNTVCVAYATGNIKEFYFDTLKYTPFSTQFIGSAGESFLTDLKMPILSISYDGADQILITNTSSLIKIRKQEHHDLSHQSQLVRKDGAHKPAKRAKYNRCSNAAFGQVSMVNRDGQILFYHKLSRSDGIVMEVPRDIIEKYQPKGLKRKMFGYGTV